MAGFNAQDHAHCWNPCRCGVQRQLVQYCQPVIQDSCAELAPKMWTNWYCEQLAVGEPGHSANPECFNLHIYACCFDLLVELYSHALQQGT